MNKFVKIISAVIAITLCLGMAGCAQKDTEDYKKEVWTANASGHYNGAAIYQMYYVNYEDVGLEYYEDFGLGSDWEQFGNGRYDIPIYVRGTITSVSLEESPELREDLQEIMDTILGSVGMDPNEDVSGKNIIIKLNDVFGLEWKIHVGYEKTNSVKTMEALVGQEVVALCSTNQYGISKRDVRADAVMWNGHVFAVSAYK